MRLGLVLLMLFVSSRSFAVDDAGSVREDPSLGIAENTSSDLNQSLEDLLIGPNGQKALALTGDTLFASAAKLYGWDKAELLRRYQAAAVDANHKLTERDPLPITHAEEDSFLPLIAKLERTNAADDDEALDAINEVQLTWLILFRWPQMVQLASESF